MISENHHLRYTNSFVNNFSSYNNLIQHPQCPEAFSPPHHYHDYAPPTFSITELKSEIEFIREKLPNLLKNIVFCHNDVHGGNILLSNDSPDPGSLLKSETPKLCIIDFEFASYNPRGFDLANHFAEYIYNYDAESPPLTEPDKLPSENQMIDFLKAYIETQQPNLDSEELLEQAVSLLKVGWKEEGLCFWNQSSVLFRKHYHLCRFRISYGVVT